MYEQHFGLSKRPFSDVVRGPDVFVGPQTATAIAGLKKALARRDAVVAVSGPAGSGKTTQVMKALEALGPDFKAFRIGRMHLRDSDLVEFLLEALGVTKLPSGAVRRFNTFRKVLAAIQAENMRVVVVIEDAVRAGVETLAELEALTAADGGPSDGANVVLMGNDGLSAFMRDPQLERLAQRTRLRQSVAPMSCAELRGYLLHAFRRSGGDFEKLFDRESVDLLAELSGGIPRVANDIVEAALAAAAAGGETAVDATLVAAVASEDLGLETGLPPTVTPEPEPEPEPEPVLESEPVIVFSDEGQDEPGDREDDIPELIQDTLPELEALTPDVVANESEPGDAGVPEPDPVAIDTFEPELPTLEIASEPEPDAVTDDSAADVPEWERDPTHAQLKPDLDALELAMAVAQDDADEDAGDVPILTADVEEPEEIPEITLDDAIQQRTESRLADAPGQAGAELEKIAAELAKAKTIEDVDDRLAETLFGEELNLIASQVVTGGVDDAPANDPALFDTMAAHEAQAAGTPIGAAAVPAEPAVEVSLETPEHGGEAGLDLSASQRLKTVRALNAERHPSLREPGNGPDPGPEVPACDVATPEPIEDQINTSMTQTLKALDVPPPIRNGGADEPDGGDDLDEKKSGFFSRFKRS